MKKRLAILLSLAVLVGIFASCGETSESLDSGSKIALIALDPALPQWTDLSAGAGDAASEAELQLITMTSQPGAEQIHRAVSDGCQGMILVGNGDDAVSEALQEALDAGVKLIYVDHTDTVEAADRFVTDHQAAGKAAGDAMRKALEAKRIDEGMIGIIGTDPADDASLQREAGFREAFSGTPYKLLETRYSRRNSAMARSIAWDQIRGGAVGIFGCGEDAVTGAGEAAKVAASNTVIVGDGQSEQIDALLEEGFIRATVTVNHREIGYESVKTMASLLAGQEQKPVPSLGVTVLESETPVVGNRDYRIALISGNSLDDNWERLAEGAMDAAKELGCFVADLSVDFGGETQQAERIRQAIDEDYHAIVVSAGEGEAVTASLQKAMDAGIRVICVETPASVEADAFLLTDNKAAGRVAAETMIAALEDQGIQAGTIGIVSNTEEDEWTKQRETGFREAFEDSPYTLLETQYCEGDAAKAHLITEQYLWKNVAGIFCCSEGATTGAGNAVRVRKSHTMVIGFDVSEAIWEMIQDGSLCATMMQNQYEMGYEGIETACALLRGEERNDRFTDTGVSVLTAEVE
ncbi:MAG: substrate-binding domain-containing protein [Faecousia sp.]